MVGRLDGWMVKTVGCVDYVMLYSRLVYIHTTGQTLRDESRPKQPASPPARPQDILLTTTSPS